MSSALTTNGAAPRVEVDGAVLQQIRRHARGSMQAEICGVLIGGENNGTTHIQACIAGEGAAQGGAHVTYTQETWAHIYKIKDVQYPDQAIVGWYHSHPGFGVFLSDYDLFIHENFFGAPHQVAWVFDPHSDEEGCFGWAGSKVESLASVSVMRRQAEVGSVVRQSEPVEVAQSGTPVDAKSVTRRSGGWRRAASLVLYTAAFLLIFGAGIFVGDKAGNQIRAFLKAVVHFPATKATGGSMAKPDVPPAAGAEPSKMNGSKT